MARYLKKGTKRKNPLLININRDITTDQDKSEAFAKELGAQFTENEAMNVDQKEILIKVFCNKPRRKRQSFH